MCHSWGNMFKEELLTHTPHHEPVCTGTSDPPPPPYATLLSHCALAIGTFLQLLAPANLVGTSGILQLLFPPCECFSICSLLPHLSWPSSNVTSSEKPFLIFCPKYCLYLQAAPSPVIVLDSFIAWCTLCSYSSFLVSWIPLVPQL